jgi:hypothetical protein
LACDTVVIEQKSDEGKDAFKDWDDTMKTIRMVRPSELKKIMAEKEAEESRRKEEAEAAAAAAKGGKPAKGGKAPAQTHAPVDVQIDESEEATAEYIDTIAEPEHEKVEGSERSVALKTSLVCDYARYECTTTRLEFKPTLMYA